MFIPVWRDFINLNATRTSNGFGINAISYSEMEAYFRVNDIKPEPWEIEIIRNFDTVVLKVYSDKSQAEQKKSKK